jgi:hypothetical protein
MENKKPVKIKVLTYVLGAVVLSGAVGEALVLYAVEDPVLRLRLGLLCIAFIAWPLAMAAWRPAISSTKDPEAPTNRRFYLLRRRVEEFLREVTRLNWLQLDANRDERTAEARREEIETVGADLHELLGEIIRAAGRPGAKPQSEEPFKERFSAAFPAVRDFAPRLEIDLERKKDEEEGDDRPE